MSTVRHAHNICVRSTRVSLKKALFKYYWYILILMLKIHLRFFQKATLTQCLLSTRKHTYCHLIRSLHIKILFIVKVYLPIPWFVYLFICMHMEIPGYMFVKCWKWFYLHRGTQGVFLHFLY